MKKLTVETTYTGYDNIDYPAEMTLEFEEGGDYSIDDYRYFKDEEWHSLSEERRDISIEEIEVLFSVTIENGKCFDTRL